MVARLRFLRRVELRIAMAERESLLTAVEVDHFRNNQAAVAIAAMSSSMPAEKKFSAELFCFCEIAKPSKPKAPAPQMIAIHFDQRRFGFSMVGNSVAAPSFRSSRTG